MAEKPYSGENVVSESSFGRAKRLVDRIQGLDQVSTQLALSFFVGVPGYGSRITEVGHIGAGKEMSCPNERSIITVATVYSLDKVEIGIDIEDDGNRV